MNQHFKTEKRAFSNFVFKTAEFRFVYNKHAFQLSLLLHLTIFLSTGEFVFKIELLVLNQ